MAAVEPSQSLTEAYEFLDDALGVTSIPSGASRIHVLLGRLNFVLNQEQAATLESTCDLSVPEWRILFVLATKGAMTQRDLVAETAMEQSHASRVMKNMQSKGQIQMDRDEKDLRRWTCSLTESGAEHFKEADPVMQQRREFLDSALSHGEFEQFVVLSNKVASRVNEYTSLAKQPNR